MIKVFEAFSGIGAQRMALRNIKASFEIVATSEIDRNAIYAYYLIHCTGQHVILPSEMDMRSKLINLGIYSNGMQANNYDELAKDYTASILSNNYGDITRINSYSVPSHDLFTYSFPCQDISSIGTRKGLDIKSGTRSSLLWECQRIIETARPRYLVMENVKNLVIGKNKSNFEKWLNILEYLGYDNQWGILDAKDFGIPQRRPRVFMVSKLGKIKRKLIINNISRMKTIDELLDHTQNDWKPFMPKNIIKGIDNINKEGTYAFLDDRDWKMNGVMISDLCSTQRAGRTGLKIIHNINNNLFERKMSALECCRLMGFDDNDYYSMRQGNLKDSIIMHLCGNSIVVNVLESIFMNILREEEL